MKTQNTIQVPLERIKIPDWNLKYVDEKALLALQCNIKNYGQIKPIQVREIENNYYEIITGRLIYQCLKKLGSKEAKCFNHGQVSIYDAYRIHLETDSYRNELNDVQIATLMKRLSGKYSVDELCETLPFSRQDIIAYINLLGFDWKKEMREFSLRQKLKKQKKNDQLVPKPESPDTILLQLIKNKTNPK